MSRSTSRDGMAGLTGTSDLLVLTVSRVFRSKKAGDKRIVAIIIVALPHLLSGLMAPIQNEISNTTLFKDSQDSPWQNAITAPRRVAGF